MSSSKHTKLLESSNKQTKPRVQRVASVCTQSSLAAAAGFRRNGAQAPNPPENLQPPSKREQCGRGTMDIPPSGQAEPPRNCLPRLSLRPQPTIPSTAAATEQEKPERVAGSGTTHLHPPGNKISRRGFRGGRRARWLEASRARRRARRWVEVRPPAWGCGDLRRVCRRVEEEGDFLRGACSSRVQYVMVTYRPAGWR